MPSPTEDKEAPLLAALAIIYMHALSCLCFQDSGQTNPHPSSKLAGSSEWPGLLRKHCILTSSRSAIYHANRELGDFE